ncbi:MAG TPA: hypothetical protein DEF51_47170 [Myxococcales bacterium]|nr:hypothetical protein [Myxococcales bacterium]
MRHQRGRSSWGGGVSRGGVGRAKPDEVGEPRLEWAPEVVAEPVPGFDADPASAAASAAASATASASASASAAASAPASVSAAASASAVASASAPVSAPAPASDSASASVASSGATRGRWALARSGEARQRRRKAAMGQSAR